MHKTRAISLADELLSAVVERSSAGGSIQLPGRPSKWGAASDKFEAVSRPLLLAGFRLGSSEVSPNWYGRFLNVLELGSVGKSGWPDARRSPQALVETASLAMGMQIARGKLFDALSCDAQDALIMRFKQCLKVSPSDNNWVIFPHVIASFLESLGLADDATQLCIGRSKERSEAWYRADGWYTDGEGRTFDYYNAWAFHFYLPLLAHLSNDELAKDRYCRRLEEYVSFAKCMIEPGGAPVFFGRSLTYRFALVAPFAVLSLLKPSRPAKDNGTAWSATVDYFMSRNATSDGLLTVGWHEGYREMAQRYSGPASPYWASKAFSALLIPDTSDFWVDESDTLKNDSVVASSRVGLLAATRNKVAILHNHGSDHQKTKKSPFFRDDPLYARRSYSSRTAPVTVAGVPDNSFGTLRSGELSGRGIVRATQTTSISASSEIRPVIKRRLLSSSLLDYGKFNRIGPRVKFVDPSLKISDTTLLSDDWDIHIFEVSGDTQPSNFRLTGWALPWNSRSCQWRINDIAGLPSARWWNSQTAAQIVGLYGFDGASIVEGNAQSPFGSHATMGFLDGSLGEMKILVAASRLYDLSESSAEFSARPSVVERDGGLVVLGGNGQILSVLQSRDHGTEPLAAF